MTADNATPKRGILADVEIPASLDMTKIKIGPFQVGEVPRLSMHPRNVYPKGSLISHITRVDSGNSYKVLYRFQNFGAKTVRVIIRRLDPPLDAP